MATNHRWYLVRLGPITSEHLLNEGETIIGRNRSAHIMTLSEICSRLHCSVTLNANDEITIESKVSIES